jgi:LEA14-like dessication related protein
MEESNHNNLAEESKHAQTADSLRPKATLIPGTDDPLGTETSGDNGNSPGLAAQQEDSAEVFDQDLVEAFLEMDTPIELGNYINEMDKARYKEIGYVLYQAFKQRKEYPEVKELFRTEAANPFDFDEAIKITTDLLLVTGKFKKLSKYVRVQLLYGLDLVKKEFEKPEMAEPTLEFVKEKWRYLKTDCIRQYSEVTGYELTEDMVVSLIKAYEKNSKPIEVIDLVQEFEFFDIEIDWEQTVKTLIETEQWDKLIMTLEHKNEFTKYAIDQMSNNKLAKNAAAVIEKMDLNINDYPLVVERLQKKTIRYYVYNYIKGKDANDYMPLWKIEDLFQGYDSMLTYICEDLAFQKEEKFQKLGKALALRNGLFDRLREDLKAKLEKVHIEPEDMKIDSVEDVFGPLSEPAEEYCRLNEDTNVTFIGSEEEVKLAEPLLESTCLGVDCEWRPSLVKFNPTGVALLQIGDKKNIFLIDMKALNESEVLDELLTKVFQNPDTNIIGMSFHCDLSALASGAPKLKFFKRIENLYDVQPMYASIYKQRSCGLSKIVDDVIGRKVCKVEQMANWERRPLRESQKHYAALDSFILVELFEKMKKYASENEVNIEDYKCTYVAGGGQQKPKYANQEMNQDITPGGKPAGNATMKTVRLKAGQTMVPNIVLANAEKSSELKFCIDYNLNRLHKLLVHMGFESVKISKKTNALERGKYSQ